MATVAPPAQTPFAKVSRDIIGALCPLDLDAAPYDFIMTRAAHMNVWLRPSASTGGTVWRIGCDPALGRYLFELVLERVIGAGGTLRSFAPAGL